MSRYLLIVFLLTVSYAVESIAQDARFSNIYGAPLWLNPAMTAAYEGNYRFNAIYRGQWSSVLNNSTSPFGQQGTPVFRTFGTSIDFKTNKGFNKRDAFGGGILMMADKSGEINFGFIQVGVRLAYSKALNRDGTNNLSFGLGFDIFQQSLDQSLLRFGDQYNPDDIQSLISSQDPAAIPGIFNDLSMAAKANAGIFWYWRVRRDNRLNVFAGAAFDNVNSPDVSLLPGAEPFNLPMRISAHGGIQAKISENFDIIPGFFMMSQNPHFEMVLGADLKLLFEPRFAFGNAFYFGTHFRMVGGDAAFNDGAMNPESIIFKTRIDYELDKHKFNIGLAYDLNVSDLTVASDTRGAIEVSLIYMGRINTRVKDILPCPRF